jgi:membrane-anchored protein YejM (alkaline phosphatase superfamily)
MNKQQDKCTPPRSRFIFLSKVSDANTGSVPFRLSPINIFSLVVCSSALICWSILALLELIIQGLKPIWAIIQLMGLLLLVKAWCL